MSRKKVRPVFGDPIAPSMSERDIAAAVGMSRRQIQDAKAIASIPEEEFERLIESDNPPTVTAFADLARGRAGLKKRRLSRCPHCGEKL